MGLVFDLWVALAGGIAHDQVNTRVAWRLIFASIHVVWLTTIANFRHDMKSQK
jgi:hypothetical protein